MKQFVKLTVVIVVCLCLISTNLLANACLPQCTYEQNDENFDISNDMINSRIRNLERINNRLSKFNAKPSAKEVEEAVVSVNPNSIVLDMNEIKGIETSDDLLKTFEERNVILPDNLDKNSLVKATQELKVISITDDKNVYFILEYNHETGQILRNPTKWCDDCFRYGRKWHARFYLYRMVGSSWGCNSGAIIQYRLSWILSKLRGKNT